MSEVDRSLRGRRLVGHVDPAIADAPEHAQRELLWQSRDAVRLAEPTRLEAALEELEERAVVGAAPLVDRLVWIPNKDRDLGGLGPALDELPLEARAVLHFVDDQELARRRLELGGGEGALGACR